MNVGIAYPAFIGSFAKYFPAIEVIQDIAKVIKGYYNLVIFSGGEDINPQLYGQNATYSVGINSSRDSREREILSACVSNKKTRILGVCRGHQLIHACMGGTLVQDIIFDLGSKSGHGGGHPLELIPSGITSPTAVAMVDSLPKEVNSIHHQAVVRQGRNMLVAAEYKGAEELSISMDTKIVTTQFHPEFDPDIGKTFFKFIQGWINNEFDNISKRSDMELDPFHNPANKKIRTATFNGETVQIAYNPEMTQRVRDMPSISSSSGAVSSAVGTTAQWWSNTRQELEAQLPPSLNNSFPNDFLDVEEDVEEITGEEEEENN